MKLKLILLHNDPGEIRLMQVACEKSCLYEAITATDSAQGLHSLLQTSKEDETPVIILSSPNILKNTEVGSILGKIKEEKDLQHVSVALYAGMPTISDVQLFRQLGATFMMSRPGSFAEYKQFARDLYFRWMFHSRTGEALQTAS